MYGPGQLLAYGIQHILTMYGGVIAAPLIVGGAAGSRPATWPCWSPRGLFVSGLATLLQTLGLRPSAASCRSCRASRSRAVSTMLAIIGDDGEDGLRTVFGAVIVAGLIGLVDRRPSSRRSCGFFPPSSPARSSP